MKTVIAAGLGALALTACAATSDANLAAPPAGFDPAAGQFEGWVRVSGGEFRLYQTEVSANQGSQQCVSGALPRNLQQASRDISGQKVRFIGRTARWSERGAGPTYDWQGSDITNSCRRDVVILAERVEVLR